MPSYDIRNPARGMVVGACQEMEFSGCLHRRMEEGMLGDGLVVEYSLIPGKPKFPTSERK